MKAIWNSAGVVALLVALSGCSGDEKPVDAARRTESGTETTLAVPVQAELPVRGDISARFETNSRIVAERSVNVTAEAMGKCVELLVEEGQYVDKGQILAELDKQEALAAIGQSEVQVRQNKSTMDRALAMVKNGIGARVDYENAKFAYEQALASLNVQKVQLDNLTIRAPIAGIVTKRSIQLGMLVSSGTPVFSIVDPTSYVLEIFPPERDLPRLREGQVATVTIDALPETEFRATVRRINPSFEKGTVKATLDFDPKDVAKLREGAFARVGLVMETRHNALLVPKDAILDENGRKYAFIVEVGESTGQTKDPEWRQTAKGAVATRVEVELGFESHDRVEILKGISDTNLVVTMGQHTLKSGAEVVVTNVTKEIEKALGVAPEEALAAAAAGRAEGKKPMAGGSRHF